MSKSVFSILVVVMMFVCVSPALAQNGCPGGTTWEQGACVPNTPTPKAPECNIFCQVAKFWTPEKKNVLPAAKPVQKAPVTSGYQKAVRCPVGMIDNGHGVCVKVTTAKVEKAIAAPFSFGEWVSCIWNGGNEAKCGKR